MAGDWIKWVKGLAKKREVVILASRLRRDRHEIAGRLMELWEWCDDNIGTDDLSDLSPDVSLVLGDSPFEFVDALLGLPGMAEAMSSSEIKWLECRSGGRVVFPNLARHNGTSAKTRAYETNKKQKQRANKKTVPAVVPKVSPISGDKIGTREEKKREELINTHTPREEEARSPPMAESFPAADPGIVCVEVDGELLHYDDDWSRWEARFIGMWNESPENAKHDGGCLSTHHRNLLKARFRDPGWFWKRALAKFPLWSENGWKPGLTWFLEEGSVQKILEGRYEQRKPRPKQTGLFDGSKKDDPTRVRTGEGVALAKAAMEKAAAKRLQQQQVGQSSD